MARCVALRAQEIQDLPSLDIEVTGELLNLDTASCRSYLWFILRNSTGNNTLRAASPGA
jgi:hypothetical protein